MSTQYLSEADGAQGFWSLCVVWSTQWDQVKRKSMAIKRIGDYDMRITGWDAIAHPCGNDTVELRCVGHYIDGSPVLRAFGDREADIWTVTVCLAGHNEKPSEGNVFIKSYGENEGVLKVLQASGAVGSQIRTVTYGFVEAYEVPVLMAVPVAAWAGDRA